MSTTSATLTNRSTVSAVRMSRSLRNRVLWIVAAIISVAILVWTLPPASSYPAPAQQPDWLVGL